MKNYFALQIKILHRQLTDFGLNLVIAYILVIVGFMFLTKIVFENTPNASYIFIALPIGIILQLNEVKRNQFLQSIFSKKQYQKIRFLENFTISLPFLVVLGIKMSFWSAFLLILVSFGLSFFTIRQLSDFNFPTPFYRYPFEFSVGFRQSYFIVFLMYVLAIVGVIVSNFNMVAFSILGVLVVSALYYTLLEPKYYVWNYALSPKQFLLKKIKVAMLYSILISFPIILLSVIFFSKNWAIILGIFTLGFLYIINFLLGKYASFPEKGMFLKEFLIGMSVFFPILLPIIIPYFFYRSIQQLKPIL